MNEPWDCIVVGGGAAGLSAALVLGRARRRTLVVDAGRQSNRPAAGIGGLLGHDGRPPGEFYAAGQRELSGYPSVELRAGEVIAAAASEDGFELTLADSSRETAKRLLLAAGMEYEAPAVPGVAERWGRSVFHCPFCHGWEVRERPLGVLDGGAGGAQRALLLSAWSDDVTLFSNGPAGLEAEDRERLEAAGAQVDERPVAELRGPGDSLAAIAFADGAERRCEALLVPVTLRQRSPLAHQLGVGLAPPVMLSAETIAVDGTQATSVPGVFAAGDLALQMPSVANAIASGSKAAAGVVHSLVVAHSPG